MNYSKIYIVLISIVYCINGYSQSAQPDFSGKKYIGYENENKSGYPFKPGIIEFIDRKNVSVNPSYYCYDCQIMCEGCPVRSCYPEIYRDTPTYLFSKDTLWLSSMFTPDYLSKQNLKINTCFWFPPDFCTSSLYTINEESRINVKLKNENDTITIKIEFDSLLFFNGTTGLLQFYINDTIYKSYIPKIKNEFELSGNFIQNLRDTVYIKVRYATKINNKILKTEGDFIINSHHSKTFDLSISFNKHFVPCPIQYLIFKNAELTHNSFTYRKKIIFR